ncbi:succinate dehydrogenase iron-sulfur subunit [Thermodesulfobacteriota bacterium]
MDATFKIFRYNPETDEKPSKKEYEVDLKPGMTVLDALRTIKDDQDGTLAFRRSCRHGICGSCAMTINGVNRLACETQISSLKTQRVEVEPLRAYPVIRDLVVDMNPFFERYERVKPYLITSNPPPTDRERLQSPEERKLLDGSYECILCGACTSSCPSFWADKEFLGPAALLKAYRFIFDTRDEGSGERLDIINDAHGLWRCHTIFNCVEACPKSLNPTSRLSALKKEVLKRRI